MNDRLFKIIAIIADIHIGYKRIKAKDLKKQLKKYFLNPLEDMKVLDGIFILGDMLHSSIGLNTEYSEVFSWFTSEVYKMAKRRKCVVIIIRGTLSHDCDQLNNIKHYQLNDDGVDFRIYDTIDKTTVFDNYKLLILPDVKISKDEEVEEFFNEKYDMILGHGLIDSMKFFAQESENHPTKTYVYDLQKLIDICNGPIIFGHIHPHTIFKDKFYYAGSFTRLEQGYEQRNGFLICGIYDNDKSRYKIEQYINEDSANFYNIALNRDDIENNSIEDIIDYIDSEIKDSRENDLITIKLIRNDDFKSADKVLIIEEKYRKDKRITISKKIKTDKTEQMEKMNEDKKERYSYIMDTNLKVEEIMYRYYEEEIKKNKNDLYSDVNINIEEFIRILNS